MAVHERLLKPMTQYFTGVQQKSGLIGVELEIEGVNLPESVGGGWVVKPENSLRTLHNGGPGDAWEYVTNVPHSMEGINNRLVALEKRLTKEGTQVVLTSRASTHIHLNMVPETFKTYFGFIMIFTAVEPVLIHLCGPERNGNLFCLPSYETGDIRRCIQHQVIGILNPGMYGWSGRGKYANLNLDPLSTLGSVEVRCFPNCIDAGTITRWAQWLVNMQTMAKTWPQETFIDLYAHIQNDPHQFLQRIFTDIHLPSAVHSVNLTELLQLGAETSYEVYRAAKPLFDFDPAQQLKKPRRKKSGGWEPSYEATIMFDDGPTQA